MFHILNWSFALMFTVTSMSEGVLTTKAESRILTITAKSYITELFIDDIKVRDLVNEDRWYLTDDVDLSPHNRLVSVTATDTSYSCGGILASVTGDYLVTDASWKCSTDNLPGWHTLGFDDSSWSDAYVIGKNDGNVTSPDECSVLIEIPSVSSNAAWIWTASIANAPVYDTTIFCRGYLPLCDTFPCRNGGTCHRNDPQVCTCPPYFFGTYCEQTNPTNTAALAKEIAILRCQRASMNVTWWFTPAGANGSSEIANNCSVLPQYLDQYAMDNANNACSLVVYAQLELGGTYACQDMSSTDDERAGAELIVLGSLNGAQQQCWSTPSSVVYGQNVTITCQLPYGGNWAPAIRWIDRYGQTVTNATTNTTSNGVTSHVVVPAFFPYVPSFTSIFYFSEASLPDVTDDTRANNTPTNIYVFATEVVDVVCPAGFTKTPRYRCYQHNGDNYDWFEADTRCRQTYPGAYLAIISDASEQKDLKSFLNTTEGYNPAWTSAFATDGCYNFSWQPMPGYFLPMIYTNWGSGQPDCDSNNTPEPCIEILNDGFWNDVRWYANRDSLCEFELTPK